MSRSRHAGINLHKATWQELLDELAKLLRGFPADARIANPVNVYNLELRASCNERGDAPLPDSRMAHMSDDEYNQERHAVQTVTNELWDGPDGELTPEQILVRAMEKDECGRSWRFKLQGYMVEMLLLSRHALKTVAAYKLMKKCMDEGGLPMSVIARCSPAASREFERITGGKEELVNPLVWLADAERGSGQALSLRGDRATRLEEFESLSRRLWHMAVTVDATTLHARILLQPDGGEADLRLLEGHMRECGVYSERMHDTTVREESNPDFDICPEGISGNLV